MSRLVRYVAIDTRGLPRWREDFATWVMIRLYRMLRAKVEVRYERHD